MLWAYNSIWPIFGPDGVGDHRSGKMTCVAYPTPIIELGASTHKGVELVLIELGDLAHRGVIANIDVWDC